MLAAHNNLNRKWILARFLVGVFDPKLDAALGEIARDNDAETALKDTEVIVEPQVLSVDAFLRTCTTSTRTTGASPWATPSRL